MQIKDILKQEKISAAEFARRVNIPKSSLSLHLKYEHSNGLQGKPLGGELCHRAMAIYPDLTLNDLRPDWIKKLGNYD